MLENKEKFSPKFFEAGTKMGKFQVFVHWITSALEVVLTITLVVGIILSFVKLPEMLKNVISGGADKLTQVVNYVALIIIAIELIHVINSQNLESVIEILMMAFTRELVIKEWEIWELLLGVFCIAGLFAVKKYLSDKEK